MKSFSKFLSGVVLLLVITGCKKDSPTTGAVAQQDSLISQSQSVNLMLPQDWVIFYASYYEFFAKVDTIMVDKISGPAPYHTWNTNAKSVELSGLEKGRYQFEWTIKYTRGWILRDTLTVNLIDVSDIPVDAKEVILTDQIWTQPWYSEVEVKDIYSIITPESRFRVFIKRDSSAVWEDVSGSTTEDSNVTYDYFIDRRLPDGAGIYSDASLIIRTYRGDPNDTPDVKIVYW